ncbi:SDR family NAD(P)-dependent oxidoreductase [Chitinophaga sp. CF418]|uniref:SDR family NAD(P)-dependent oxidoreductase n=1 Tax=Chitinophaga sp. CF418 TaxID=1855287 RepID=UPI000921B614|nr:SDR family oxidoreductase [Chitinophaga sp. CF418]SHN32943.1 NAD(P)-dependent dehydrogenase, short-chain alcohol dehydrogenase family [Chitinophaga sp. CF418]
MNRNILITGGSSGIGEGIARHFYSIGWQVLITGRNKEKLVTLANELPGLNTLEYDTQIEGDEQKILQFIRMNWSGKLDVLINNADHVELTPLKGISSRSMESMYRTHVIAPTLLTSGCLDFLTATKGHIINISSSHGIKVYPEISAYAAAKAGINMLTKTWALELAPLGIRVNAVAPGPTNTPVLANAGLPLEIIQAIHESERTSIPLQRRGDVTDIVAHVAMLATADSSWVTGVILPVDGGLSVS